MAGRAVRCTTLSLSLLHHCRRAASDEGESEEAGAVYCSVYETEANDQKLHAVLWTCVSLERVGSTLLIRHESSNSYENLDACEDTHYGLSAKDGGSNV